MPSWLESLFGPPPPPPPSRPPSRGAMFGMNYQTLPTSQRIVDRRQDPFDYAYWMQRAPSTLASQVLGEDKAYQSSMSYGSTRPGEADPMTLAANDPLLSTDMGSDVAPYSPSFRPNWKAPPSRQAPYQRFDVGPNLPRPSSGSAFDPEMPYAGPHLPISPGDPGWTSPPSPSGPHNRQGDPARPGYDRPGFNTDLDSPSQYEVAPVDGRPGFDAGGGVDDLGDYDVQAVDGNPFGSMASSPNDYDVAPVDHDPFQSLADRYITSSGDTVRQSRPPSASSLADKYISKTGGAGVAPTPVDPRFTNAMPEWEAAPLSEEPQFSPVAQNFILRSGGLEAAQARLLQAYPNGPPADDLGQWSTLWHEIAQAGRGEISQARPITPPQIMAHAPPGLRSVEEWERMHPAQEGLDPGAVSHPAISERFGGAIRRQGGGGVYREAGGGREYITPKQSLDLTSAITDEQGKPLGATGSQVPPALPGVPPWITGLYRTLYPTSAETGELPPRYWPKQPTDRVGFDDGGGITDLGEDDNVEPVDTGLGSIASAPDQFELAARQPEATPSSAGGPPLDPGDRDLLIKTVFGESSGEPALGQAGIAHAILNRVRAGGYGQGIRGVVMAPAWGENPKYGYHEFSPWNTGRATEGNPTAQHLSPDSPNPILAKAYRNIGDIVDKVYSGLIPDPTGGATHYYGRMRGHPSWSPPLAAQNQVRIGGTTFVGREHGPGQSGYRVAAGYQGGGGVTDLGEVDDTEWTGGRIYARAFSGGITDQNEALRRRIEFLQRPRYQSGGDVDPGFSQLDQMVAQDRLAHPDAPAPTPAPVAPQTLTPEGQSVKARYESGMGKYPAVTQSPLELLGSAVGATTEAAGRFGASAIADPFPSIGWRTMSPESEALLGRDLTGMLDSPIGFSEMAGVPRPPSPFAPRIGEVGSDVAHAAAPGRAQIMDINGVKRHIDPEFPESRVGTAVPSNEDPDAAIAAEQAAHANNNAHVGMDLAAQAPSHGKAVANMVRNGRIPYVKVAAGADDATVQEALIEHMKNNLLGLYNRVSGAVRSGSKLWYEGANTRSRDIAVTHDIPHENAAGVVAAMSPQKDWDQNVTLADWVAHTAGTTADDATMSPEMTAWVNKYALRKDAERVVTDPETGKETRYNARTGEVMAPNSVSQQDVLGQLNAVSGKNWGQMTPSQKAFYTRAYYEAHGPPDHLMPIDDQTGQPSHWVDDKGDHKYGYYINNPDGTHNGVIARYGDEYPKVKGQPIPVSWGSTGEVSNAIQAFHAQSMGDISEALGDGHKVRSFFNNIIAPWSKKGDVTSDTHAVAAALLRPLGAGSPEAASGMGAASPTNNATGLKGFYPHVAEAYRRAAKEAGVLPRELQSITWEALRGLWSPREKMAKSNVRTGFTSQTDITNGIWQRYHNNQMTMEDAHNAILGPQGERIDPPRWFNTFRP
jgi:hypothetical protein